MLALEPVHLDSIARGYASQSAVWMPQLQFRTDERWSLRLHGDNEVDVWLITWLQEQSTAMHDHGGSAGAFTVVHGTLREYLPSGARARAHRRYHPQLRRRLCPRCLQPPSRGGDQRARVQPAAFPHVVLRAGSHRRPRADRLNYHWVGDSRQSLAPSAYLAGRIHRPGAVHVRDRPARVVRKRCANSSRARRRCRLPPRSGRADPGAALACFRYAENPCHVWGSGARGGAAGPRCLAAGCASEPSPGASRPASRPAPFPRTAPRRLTR
jgi:hypothetical protein